MKIILGGMYEHQLSTVADELRAEFPEHRFEVVDSRTSPRRLAAEAKNADLAVMGRFIKHSHRDSVTDTTGASVITVTSGGAGRIKAVVETLLRRRAP